MSSIVSGLSSGTGRYRSSPRGMTSVRISSTSIHSLHRTRQHVLERPDLRARLARVRQKREMSARGLDMEVPVAGPFRQVDLEPARGAFEGYVPERILSPAIRTDEERAAAVRQP